jgi:hypothetical protein
MLLEMGFGVCLDRAGVVAAASRMHPCNSLALLQLASRLHAVAAVASLRSVLLLAVVLVLLVFVYWC